MTKHELVQHIEFNGEMTVEEIVDATLRWVEQEGNRDLRTEESRL